jgi:DNA-binding response OmpR family regulator
MSTDRDHQVAPNGPGQAQPIHAVSASLAGTRVFLAEDEPMLLWALEEALTNLGCEVVGAATRVSEALAFAACHSFDVAVLDATLADGQIDPVVAVLVARSTPVIIASGAAPADCMERFGNVVAIQKPYKDSALHQALLRVRAQTQFERKLVL